ncbi:MAG: ATP-dependent helicase [Anaerolineae bacterium]
MHRLTDILAGLNPAQAQAVQAIDGPVLVLAGPGSGKTRVLTHRIAYLIRECGVRPYNILAVTFTNKAAREMVSRLERLIGESTGQLTIGTFHAICARILRREAAHLGMGSNFVIYDDDDQRRLITRILKEFELDSKQYGPAAVHGAISRAKNELVTPATYQPKTYWHEVVGRVFERYEDLKTDSNALDFDDLLLKAEELFRAHDEVRERYQKRYLYLLVDEFQDTNRAQYDLVMHLASARRNVFVVGDEDQSIYSWRGADFRNVKRFRSDFPDATVLLLEQNYRSTQTILNAAQAVISHNAQRTNKHLWTSNADGRPIHVIEAYEEREEAEFVAGEIQRLVARQGHHLGDCAVMYRTNAQSRAIEDALIRHKIPYKLVGGTRFYQRREVKDVLAYLRVIHNPDDGVSLLRVLNVPNRGIGEKTVEQLVTWGASLGLSTGAALLHLAHLYADEGDFQSTPFNSRTGKALLSFAEPLATLRRLQPEKTLTELLGLLLERVRYLEYLRDGTEEGEDRANNVRELFTVTDNYANLPSQAALASFLEEVALVADSDELDAQANAVTLLTLHTAKGLEYEAVFIVGMEEGICPHNRAMDDPDGMEEERRLCYVGFTRAKKDLYLLRTFRRTLYGSSDLRQPSRFLLDIPEDLVEGNPPRRQAPAGGPAPAAAPMQRDDRRDLIARRRASIQQNVMGQRLQRDTGTSRRPGLPGGSPPVKQESEPPRTSRPRRSNSAATFRPGETVVHPTFGSGIVISSQVSGDDEEVTVAFEGRGIKRLMAGYAHLEKA